MTFINFLVTFFQTALKLINAFINKFGLSFLMSELFIQILLNCIVLLGLGLISL